MPFDITIVSADVQAEFDTSIDEAEAIPSTLMGDIEDVVMAQWQRLAADELDTSLAEYSAAMRSDRTDTSVRFYLDPDNETANIVESGQDAGVQQLNPRFTRVSASGELYQHVPISNPHRRSFRLRSLGSSPGQAASTLAARRVGVARARGDRIAELVQLAKMREIERIPAENRIYRTMTNSQPWHRSPVIARRLLERLDRQVPGIVSAAVEGYAQQVRTMRVSEGVGRRALRAGKRVLRSLFGRRGR